ncbi:short-chain alcohol dehydrogenase [Mycobacteroides abscessus subsp. abscessus]|nr:short-chain alcohol dehydrogenase [Mycobacteroides abscessus subsp. abscessus]
MTTAVTSLPKPTALITGASRGLGAAIARELAPTHDLLLGARTADSLRAVLDELPGASAWPVELTDYEAVAAATEPIRRLDVLVHNAGVADLGTIAESSVAQWRTTLEANANAGWGSYAASKFGLRAFGDALRLEEPTLRVTSVHPGRIDTDMQRAIVADEGREYRPEEFLTPETVARAVRHAVETPRDGHPTEIVLRPTPPR